MLKKSILGLLFLAAFFVTVQYLQDDSSVAGLRWGAGLEVSHARGK